MRSWPSSSRASAACSPPSAWSCATSRRWSSARTRWRGSRAGASRYPADEVEEVVDFLAWLQRGEFVFLGAREYDFTEGGLQIVPGSGLGILADEEKSSFTKRVPFGELPDYVRRSALEGDLLLVDKSNAPAPVHRRERMDYIGVRRVDDGRRDRRHVARDRPVHHQGLRRAGLRDAAAAPQAAPVPGRPRADRGLARLQGRRRALRHVPEGRAVRRARGRPARRAHLAAGARGHAEGPPARPPRPRRAQRLADPHAAAGPLRRLAGGARARPVPAPLRHLQGRGPPRPRRLRPRPRALPRPRPGRAARAGAARARARGRRAHAHLGRRAARPADRAPRARSRGRRLAEAWLGALPEHYKGYTSVDMAAHDVACFERLAGGEGHVVSLHAPATQTRIGLYESGEKVQLSQAMPMLEDLGLRVLEEVATRLTGEEDDASGCRSSACSGPDGEALDIDTAGRGVAEMLAAVWRGDAESDPLNRLVVASGLDRHQIAILRAYRKYRQRIGSRFTESYQNDVLAANPELTAKLVRYFATRFDPERERDEAAETALREEILADLDDVVSLDHDRILRNQLGLIDATLRTNAYKPDRAATSFKLRSADVPAIPQPRADVRDLHLLAGDGGHPPARRPDRPRRAPLVGPDGLPHRGLRADARPADQERDHRPRRRQGRLHPAPRADRPGASWRPRSSASTSPTSARSWTSRTTWSTARSCTRRTCACSTTTTPTWWSRPTRARRRCPTPRTRSPPSTASGSTTRSPPAARSATTTRSSASRPAAPGSRSSATSARSTWTRRSTSSAPSGSATCRATCSATGCC